VTILTLAALSGTARSAQPKFVRAAPALADESQRDFARWIPGYDRKGVRVRFECKKPTLASLDARRKL